MSAATARPMWQSASLADAAALPWRNGGGTTRELAAWPAGDHWSWRMSVAQVSCDGPFSPFPGITRWFAVLNGAGIRLDIGEQTRVLHASTAPCMFDGGAACRCTLLGGSTQDFNLMVQSRFASHMLRVQGTASHPVHGGGVLAVYAIDGPATLTLNGAAWTIAAGHLGWLTDVQAGTAQVESGNALLMEICS